MNSAFSHKRGKSAGAFSVCALACLILSASIFAVPLSVGAQGVPIQTDAPTAGNAALTAGKTTASLVVQGKQLVESTLQTAKAYADNLKEWVGDGLVKYIAQTTLRGITQSVVNWINNDFQGSPSFLTNPDAFFTNLADKVIGRTIQQIDPLWCEPFRLQLRAAFSINYGFNSNEEVHCRLTDVIANVQGAYDSFVGGDFTNGGWKSWVSITGNQQSNVYGAYLNTVDKVDASIVTASGREIKLLDFGQGFRSWKKCLEPGEPVEAKDKHGATLIGPDEATPIMKPGPCKREGPIETPGSIIQDNLKESLNSDLMGLNIADEINEIVAALANVMIRKVMTSGLSGSSDYITADYANASTLTQGECDPANPDSRLNPRNPKYDARLTPGSATYNAAIADAFVVRCQRSQYNYTLSLDTFKVGDSKQQELITVSGGGAPTGATRADNVANNADAASAATVAAAAAAAGANQGNFGSDINLNLAGADNGRQKITRQSSTPNIFKHGAEKAVDGSTEGTNANSLSVIQTGADANAWWEVDLGETYTVGKVQLWPRRDGNTFDTYLGGAYIFLSDQPYSGGAPNAAPGVAIPAPATEINMLEIPVNLTGRYLRVQRIGKTSALSFAELKAFQGDTNRKNVTRYANLTQSLYNPNGNSGDTRKGIVSPASIGQGNWRTSFPQLGSIKAIDGNRNGNYHGDNNASLMAVLNPFYDDDCYVWSSCGPGAGANFAWWEIDLGGVYDISEVQLWRRTDIAFNDNTGLNHTYIFVTDGEYNPTAEPVWSNGINIMQAIQGSIEPRPMSVPVNKRGRYLRIQKKAQNLDMWFSEIQILAAPQQQAGGAQVQNQPSGPIFPLAVSPAFAQWEGTGETTGQTGRFAVSVDRKDIGGEFDVTITNTTTGTATAEITMSFMPRLEAEDSKKTSNITFGSVLDGFALSKTHRGATQMVKDWKCTEFSAGKGATSRSCTSPSNTVSASELQTAYTGVAPVEGTKTLGIPEITLLRGESTTIHIKANFTNIFAGNAYVPRVVYSDYTFRVNVKSGTESQMSLWQFKPPAN